MHRTAAMTMLLLAAGSVLGAGELLGDGGFEAAKSAWRKRTPYGARVELNWPGEAHGGTRAAHLRTFTDTAVAGVEQGVGQMAAGLYELTAWCKGKGTLRLTVRGGGSRRSYIAEGGWHRYSLVFETTATAVCAVSIGVRGDAWVDDASLVPADAECRAAWGRQQQALSQFGFVPSGYLAQRPAPRSAARPAAVSRKPVSMTHKAVFYDPRYDAAWNTRCDLIAAWFARRGFAIKGARELAAWMSERAAKSAYGSVVVMAMGLVPDALIAPLDETCVLRRYLDAGGRMVWTGDTALYVAQGETGPTHSVGEAAMPRVLGIPCDRAAWHGTPQLTEAGKRWGLRGPGSCIRAVRRELVTLSLAEDPKEGTSAIWLLTTNPDYPLSGFLASVFTLDGRSTGALEDFCRMALFVGEPVTLPRPAAQKPRPRPPVVMALTTEAGGAARRAFVRGEKATVRLSVTTGEGIEGDHVVRILLTPNAPRMRTYDLAAMGLPKPKAAVAACVGKVGTLPVLWTHAARLKTGADRKGALGPLTLDTTPLPVGDYQLFADLLHPGSPVPVRACQPLAICPRPRRDRVYLGMRGPMPRNPYRLYGYLDDLAKLGLDLQCSTHIWPQFADACLRNGQTFVVALEGPDGLVEPRKNPDGSDVPNPWAGGRPGLKGLAGQACRDKALKVFEEDVRPIAPYPAFSKVLITNDDFSARGGWDYNPKNLAEFKAKTGLDAPVPAELVGKPVRGARRIKHPTPVVPDDDPWLRWNEFLCRDVAGGYNDATRRGVQRACPGALIGPVPGGAQWPLFMISSGQYPPMNFGHEFGFNCPWYYCYEGYWQPSLAYLYWSEVARMGHRDLPVWTMPDAGGDARHYIRNVAHLLLAAGNRGIVYFIWSWTAPEGRKELADLGRLLERHGPLLARLRPAPKRVGLLVPFSNACFDPGHPLQMVYVFANLAQAHIPAEPLAEEELDGSMHHAIALSGVTHLREGTVAALGRFVKNGGIVLIDRDCTVTAPGARKLAVSLGQGTDRKGLNIRNYGVKSRIDAVRSALAPLAPPIWDSPEATTVVRPFVAPDGTAYAYVVQVDSHEEYSFYRTNVYEPNVQGKTAPASKEQIDRFLRQHGMREHVKDTAMTVTFAADLLPKGEGCVVDVFRGEVLEPKPAGEGRLAVTVRTRRFGGTLLAVQPAPVGSVVVAAPKALKRGETAQIRVVVRDARGQPMRGVCSAQVTVRDAKGRADAELSGFYAVERGQLALSLSPAAYSPGGEWTIEAMELTSGKKGRASIDVR